MGDVRPFKNPQETLGSLEPTTAGTVITVATDVALIVDADGIVRDVSLGRDDAGMPDCSDWIGRHWSEIVSAESRQKVETLRREASTNISSAWRQINHRSPLGTDLPVMYAAVQIGREGKIIAVGRDLRDLADLQQRLVQAQQALERDYARLRQAEMRYRLLFLRTSEPVLIVDAATLKVTEANRAAEGLSDGTRPIVGTSLLEAFDAPSAAAIEGLLATIRSLGTADEVRARLADGEREFRVSASLFRQDQTASFLVRLSPIGTSELAAAAAGRPKELCPFAQAAADGFVVTDPSGRISAANRAFLDMAQLSVERQAIGQSLDRWLGRAGVDLRVLLNSLRDKGTIRLFATTLHGELGSAINVEVSAAAVVENEAPACVFLIRNVNQRLNRPLPARKEMPRSVEQLSELIGTTPLKEIVREATDIIERLCIEAALEMTGDNRASAAELLGLSRQSLYVKLRRYGIDDEPS
jgi:transcriptional regulator PpsR